jgi:bacterioferritin
VLNPEAVMADQELDKTAVVNLLNEILETELAGVVRYTHYSLMIFGHNRIPSSVGCAAKPRLA